MAAVHVSVGVLTLYVICVASEKTSLFSSTPNALSTNEQNVADICFQRVSCPENHKYRSIDGSCNNKEKTWWGAANTPYVRLMKPVYKDAHNNYRVSVVDKSELPSARVVSHNLLHPKLHLNDTNTRMFIAVAQLIAHDVLANPRSEGPNCCSTSGDAVVSTTDGCRPILVPETDSFFSKFGRKCIEYRQSTVLENCSALPASPLLPLSVGSHFLDASVIYGLSESESKRLREFKKGYLATSNNGTHQTYLPTQKLSKCPLAKKICYKGADPRANLNLDIAVIETIWLRFHNQLANLIAQSSPEIQDQDEILFQEARRWLIAFFQQITYGEWMPKFLGAEYAASLELTPLSSGYATGYDPNLNPSSIADFAGAAFRTLHSYTPDLTTINTSGRLEQIPYSATVMKAGDYLYPGDGYDSDIIDLTKSHGGGFNNHYSLEILNNLILPVTPKAADGTYKFGDDLAAMDIQRGRDYGLPGYNDYRALSGLKPFKTFDELGVAFGKDVSAQLSTHYKSPDDIDYYVGSLLEATVLGVSKAQTLKVIWGEQFRRYKFGDSHFYEFGDHAGAFTPAQLQLIRSLKFSTIVCLGGNHITHMQPDVFSIPDKDKNPLVPCHDLIKDFLANFKASLSSV